jgi:hypothetical protein
LELELFKARKISLQGFPNVELISHTAKWGSGSRTKGRSLVQDFSIYTITQSIFKDLQIQLHLEPIEFLDVLRLIETHDSLISIFTP